ncbi:polymer-forming cytoskeletal protein [Xanthocytophaga agilis]|uniref:Polymer-forming cytoskeletal protein n=1 Tax=Xanthocytophaga agilis TaxID=3048010 RepID=A0AAE3R7D0_9BACT|nr:polymer-forming cytoskeletal protein [Xanthocytophaga agilis]MDJ1505094.1 polymer-forming cytoskeletal protein [Xanthocytophaga agilis]
MFNRNRDTQDSIELSNASTQIMKGTTIEGNIDTYGNLRIEGKVIGNIKSKTKVALGESSYIEGNIIAQNAEIAGEVKGTVEISDILSLKSTANIVGDIITGKLIVEAGAVWNGTIKMGTASANTNNRIGDTLNEKLNEQKEPLK